MGSTGIENLNIKRTELSEVYCPDDPQVDIVLVHGLNGHPQRTWTANNGVFWPSQLLPKTLGHVRARVLVYGYNADVYAFGGRSATSDYILQHAQTLVMTLDSERFNEDASERPIIFVAHSLGGILVKKALDYSCEITNVNNENLRSVFVSTFGIIFLGTPHNGADPAKWGKMVQSMCNALLPKKVLDTEPQLITALKIQSETLQNINVSFANIMDKFHVAFFHEAEKTDFGLFKDFVVDQTSAAPIMPGPAYAGIEATHSGMCKFESKNSPGYTSVASTIKRYAQEAPMTIAARWQEEHELRGRARKFLARELTVGVDDRTGGNTPKTDATPNTGNFHTPSESYQSLRMTEAQSSVYTKAPSRPASEPADDVPDHDEPLFIAPSGYRPNAIFVGMKRELAELDEKLFDVKSRERGSACVLLCCLSGGGKSHLARQYVYTQREKFPGGIFWVRAKSKAEIAQGFWDIAQKAALKDVQDPRSAQYEQDTEVFIKTVKRWFERRQEWLLVFDGITIDGEDEIAGLQAFLPDSKNSSVILTSVDRSLAGRHRLLDPSAVRVMALEEDESRQLLFQELNISNPTKAQTDKATELARKVGGLPLAIHAIGHRVRETKEPLVKYHIRPYSSDPRLREPFIEIMEDLYRLQHLEASHLVFILCFFRENIPVEMIQLGVKALKQDGVEVKARTRGSRPDLNTTFSILMRYALIDRNEPDDGASQSSHTSLVQSIDMLKIHSVVQTFLAETLKAAGQLHIWLGHAVKVFCHSFEEAHRRISKGAGLVKDYREYEIHGNRLMEHVMRNRPKSADLQRVHTELGEVLRMVRENIQEKTATSSDEAAIGHYYKVSVFDRTSSSSSAGPETPHQSEQSISTWGLQVSDVHLASPTEIVREPEPHEVIRYSPRIPLVSEDAGYQSDLDHPFQGKMTGPSISQGTARPSRADDSEGEWQMVNNRRQKKRPESRDIPAHRTLTARQQRRYKDSVNSWRYIEPSYSDPRVTRVTAERVESSGPRRDSRGDHTGSSEAELALAAFRREGSLRESPVSSLLNEIGEKAASVGRHLSPSRLTYADALSGRLSLGSPPVGIKTGSLSSREPSIGPMGMQREQSSESGSGQRNDAQRSASRFAGGLSAHQFSSQSVPVRSSGVPMLQENQAPPHSSQSSPGIPYPEPMQSSDPDLRNPSGHYLSSERLHHIPYNRAAVQGRNPNPIPLEEISVATKRQLPSEFRGHGRSDSSQQYQPSSSSMNNMPRGSDCTLSSYPDVRRVVYEQQATGYTSQPMSRDASGNSATSHISITDTEPARFPPHFSPRESSMPLSPRERLRDGAPLRKSPKFRATQSELKAIDVTPRFVADQDLTAMGGWLPSPTETAMSMSRSSSGPGIAASGTFIRFGDQEPIDVGVAEMRAAQQRERLQRDIEKGVFRPSMRDRRRSIRGGGVGGGAGGLPYPRVSFMPRTESDVRAMMEEEVRGRPRGISSPDQPHGVSAAGLAVSLGPGFDDEGLRPR